MWQRDTASRSTSGQRACITAVAAAGLEFQKTAKDRAETRDCPAQHRWHVLLLSSPSPSLGPVPARLDAATRSSRRPGPDRELHRSTARGTSCCRDGRTRPESGCLKAVAASAPRALCCCDIEHMAPVHIYLHSSARVALKCKPSSDPEPRARGDWATEAARECKGCLAASWLPKRCSSRFRGRARTETFEQRLLAVCACSVMGLGNLQNPLSCESSHLPASHEGYQPV